MSDHDQPPMVIPPYSSPVPSPHPPMPMDYDSEMYRGKDLREYLHILLKRKWWIIGTFFSIFSVVAVYTFLRTPIFRTSTTLQITEDNPASQVTMEDKMSRMFGSDSPEKFQQTQYKILKSWSLAQRVAQALNLAKHPAFKSIREKNPNKSDAEIETDLANLVMAGLEVNPVKNSYLVEVAFQSPDKSLTQQVVNAVADQYMYLSIDRRNESFVLVRKWLDKQLQAMAGKVQEAQQKLYKFGQKTDIYTMEDKDNVVVQKFIDLSGLLTKAQAEKMAKNAQYQQIKDKGPNSPLIVNHPLVASLRQQLVAQLAKVSALQKVFRSNHPDMQAERANLAELQTRIQGEVKRLQESVKADYEAANRTEKLLSDSFSDQKGEMVKLQDNLTDFQILKRDAQTNEQLYQALLSRVKEASIAGTMVPANVAAIDQARLPNAPFKPKIQRDLSLAALLALILGIGLALLREHMDDSIKSMEDLERACNLPSLGVLPLLGSDNGRLSLSRQDKFDTSQLWRYLPWPRRSGQSDAVVADDIDLMVYKQPKSQLSEAIGHIYSSIMLSASGRPPRVIMITSPNPSDGKTMIVTNLALSYALNGRKVVVIDCDMRKPRVHRIFKTEPQPGLSNYLAGSATLEEILRDVDIPNLTVLPGGSKPPSPVTLLNSDVFKELLLQLRQQFDHIVIDTPPVLGFADARIISTMVDGLLLVTKYQRTQKSAGRMACQLLQHAPILGVVLNSIGAYGHGYGTYYYYTQYKYYSKYYEDKVK
jgi:succinoglycan biosynthesis transport protein ExoP